MNGRTPQDRPLHIRAKILTKDMPIGDALDRRTPFGRDVTPPQPVADRLRRHTDCARKCSLAATQFDRFLESTHGTEYSTRVDLMSTRVVGECPSIGQDRVMRMGKRIQERLDELGWTRPMLLAAVPDMSAQTLHALIKRDSEHSTFEQQIAQALGLNREWLVFGTGQKLIAIEPQNLKSSNFSKDEELIIQAYRLAGPEVRLAFQSLAQSVHASCAKKTKKAI